MMLSNGHIRRNFNTQSIWALALGVLKNHLREHYQAWQKSLQELQPSQFNWWLLHQIRDVPFVATDVEVFSHKAERDLGKC